MRACHCVQRVRELAGRNKGNARETKKKMGGGKGEEKKDKLGRRRQGGEEGDKKERKKGRGGRGTPVLVPLVSFREPWEYRVAKKYFQ